MASKNFTAKFSVDVSQLKKGISDATKQIKLANATFKAQTAGLDDWTKSADGLAAKLDELAEVLKNQKTILSNYREQLARVREAQQKNSELAEQHRQKLRELAEQGVSKSSEEYKKYKTALQQAEAELKRNDTAVDKLKLSILNQEAAVGKTEKEIKNYKDQVDKLGDESKETAKQTDNLGDETEEAGKKAEKAGNGGFTVLRGALADLVASGIQKAADGLKQLAENVLETGIEFDSSMSKVQALSGATGTQIEQLEGKARELGESTAFSATEVADGFSYMAMAGWETEDMLNGISGILSLASANGLDLATTSDIVTDALTAFGYEADDASHFADVLAIASSSANTNVQMMGETFKYAATAAGTLHYSAEDVALSVGLMANSGIKASQAGTQLNTIFSNLAANTDGARTAIEELGIEFYDQSTGEARAWGDVLDDLREKTANYNSQQKIELANTIAGKRAQNGLLAMLNAEAGAYDDLSGKINNANGAAQEMSDTMLDNLGGDITLLKSAAQEFALSLFDNVNSPLRDMVQGITNDIMPALTGLFTGDEGAAEALGKGVGDLLTKAGDFILGMVPKFAEVGVNLISTLIGNIVDFAADDANWTRIFSAIAAVLNTIESKIVEGAPKLIEKLPTVFKNIASFIINNARIFTRAFSTIIKALSKTLPPLFSSLFKDVLPEVIPALIDSVNETFPVLWDALSEVGDQLAIAIITALPDLIDLIADDLPDLLWSIVYALTSISQRFTLSIIKILAEGFAANFPELLEVFLRFAPDLIMAMSKAMLDNLPLIIDTSLEMGDEVIKSLIKAGKDFVSNWDIFKNIGEKFGKMWDDALDSGRNFLDKLKNFFSPLGDFFKNMLNKIIGGINTIIDGLNGVSFNIPDWVPVVGGKRFGGFGLGRIPTLQEGGILPRGKWGLLEGNGAEAVVPLDQNKTWIAAVAADMVEALSMKQGAIMGGGGNYASSKINNFTQIINAPKQPTRLELYRQTKNLLSNA